MRLVRQYASLVGIIAAAVMVFALQQLADRTMMQWFSLVPVQVRQAWASLVAGDFGWPTVGPLTTLLTAAFLHADFEHLLYNMIFLWTFGALATQHTGQGWALAVFLATAVAGNVTQLALNPGSTIPVLGASGGVCGLEGFYLGLALRCKLPWPDVWPLAQPIPPAQLAAFGVLGFAFDAYSLMNHQQGVAYGAHLGGFLSGVALAGLLSSFRLGPSR